MKGHKLEDSAKLSILEFIHIKIWNSSNNFIKIMGSIWHNGVNNGLPKESILSKHSYKESENQESMFLGIKLLLLMFSSILRLLQPIKNGELIWALFPISKEFWQI